ncbi:hypothetical protein K3N28_06880 [Glycomyces sp. TRM65418]|uniref:hypothetical protein n=1 Tax=Glycomyces sp. TRM65418 TaxID=2867006 RepID=UPI001CE5774B|nr:hypothetical protein [Glycomyces sp. TRM65418]MCC3762795.1 hypothetical protein [Glycomyces sp. TRM65418]QZD56825.1 hypothetical protein K3N28_06830 [Glycomyces sp. TRM65418]
MTDTLETAPERVVVVLFRSGAVKRVNDYAADLIRRGVAVTALVADGQGWGRALPLHPGIEVYSLGRTENRNPLLWTYVALVERLPGGVLRRLRERLPGPLGRAAGFAERVHRKIAGKLRKHLFWPVYRPLRSQAMRRLALRRLDALRLDGVARVICADESTIPFGWALARRRPDLEVTRALDSSVYEHRPVVASSVPWDPEEPGAAERPPYMQV